MEKSLSSDADLLDYLRAAKQHGLNDEFVVALLRQNGWPERRIFRAYSELYANVIGTPLPVRRQRSESARDAFYYLLNFITLGFWTVGLGQIFYHLIAQGLPDATQDNPYLQSAREDISWQIATVVVAFPIYYFVHALISRELRARPDLYESGVRKWLTYIALVIAAIIVITDAVWFIQALIRGELTLRFILDSLVLLVLGGGVFAYYLKTMEPPAHAQ